MSVKVKNRHRLKEKDLKSLVQEFTARFHAVLFDASAIVETGTIEDFHVILINDGVDFFLLDGKMYLTIQGVNAYAPKGQYVVVDMGAVRFVTNGADIMGPGIVDADPAIIEGDQVWVCDVAHRKPLAVGVALISGEEMRQKKPGKAVKNIHYVSDALWALIR